MLQNSPSVYVSLDVHKESLAVAMANPERGGEIRFYGNQGFQLSSDFSCGFVLR